MQVGCNVKGGLEIQSVVANVDWLAVTVRFGSIPDWEHIQDPPDHRLRVLGCTAIWKDRVLLVNDADVKVATILSRPRNSKLMHPNVGLIEIANEWLYHGAGWPWIFHVIRQVAPFEILGISRADICADFNPNPLQRDVIVGLSENRYYVGGKRNGAGFWSSTIDKSLAAKLAEWTLREHLPHCQTWGHKTSDVKWKIYYKTRELYEVEDKPYIRDQWEVEGLDVRDVWRLEVSLRYPHRLLRAGMPITYEIFNHEWWSILRSLYQTRFEVRRNEGHADRSNDELIDFIPALSVAGTDLKCRPSVNCNRKNGRIPLLRKLVKSVEDEPVLMNDTAREGVLWLVDSIVTEDHLHDYFTAMVGEDVASWMESVRVDAYSRVAACKVGGLS